MEFDELFVPPDLGNDYAAGLLTRLFGGIIPRLHGEGDDAVATTNWFEAILTVFNAFCLLAMLVILSYTIYTMIFDTAADGKTFGQSTDTKYTILRTVFGVVGFVPIVGGYSLAQVAFLWIVLQGSAFADVTWREVATRMLNGSPLVSATVNRVPADAQEQLGQFGMAYDTLVTGHLCGMNANRISAVLAGTSPVPASAITTVGGSGPIQQEVYPANVEVTSAGWLSGLSGRQSVGMSQVTAFEEADGGTQYSGRDNYCGAVILGDNYTAIEGASGDLEAGLLAARAQAQFSYLVSDVMPDLSAAARDVAQQIFDGERDAETLLAPSRAAIYAAVADYLGAGPATSTVIDSDEIEDVHDELLDMVSEEGWMMAPVWQRGVAQTVSQIELPGTSLSIDTIRENRVAEFLSGEGYRTNRRDRTTDDMLRKANSDQDTWDELASQVRLLPPPDVGTPRIVSIGDSAGGGISNMLINSTYRMVLDVFSPVANTVGGGNGGFRDPMVQVQRQGALISTAGGTLLTVGTVASIGNESIAGRAASLLGTDAVVEPIVQGATSTGTTLLIVGMIMLIIVPLVPMVYFFTSVASWILQIIETLFSVPLAILQLFTPSREATLIGGFTPVLLSVFAVFLRPFFMIVGLILAMLFISVALDYLHELFARVMFFDDGGVPGFGLIGFVVDGLWGLVKIIFLLILYVLLAFLTVLYGSQIISEFGDFAMNMIGAGVSRYAQPTQIADRTIMAGGIGYMGARSFAQGPAQLAASRVRGIQQRRNDGGDSTRLIGR